MLKHIDLFDCIVTEEDPVEAAAGGFETEGDYGTKVRARSIWDCDRHMSHSAAATVCCSGYVAGGIGQTSGRVLTHSTEKGFA